MGLWDFGAKPKYSFKDHWLEFSRDCVFYDAQITVFLYKLHYLLSTGDLLNYQAIKLAVIWTLHNQSGMCVIMAKVSLKGKSKLREVVVQTTMALPNLLPSLSWPAGNWFHERFDAIKV